MTVYVKYEKYGTLSIYLWKAVIMWAASVKLLQSGDTTLIENYILKRYRSSAQPGFYYI